MADGVAIELHRQGWRSVSIVFPPYGVVLSASEGTPDFLKGRVGRVKPYDGPPQDWFDL